MLTLPKLLILLLILGGVWFFFRTLDRRNKSKQKINPKTAQPKPRRKPKKGLDLQECPTCKTWVMSGVMQPCERPDCPMTDQ